MIARVLHIATVHFKSPRWIPIQTRELRRNMSIPYRMWISLEGIDPSYGRQFHRAIEQQGMHAHKLNELASEIANEAEPDDLLMFLDGDAFPVVDPWPLIEEGLGKTPLLAVRRAENCDERQPHPCFCVIRVATWSELNGDWTEAGMRVLRQLQRNDMDWTEVRRSNRQDLHPLFYAVYGNAIYHHGAGFRNPVSFIDAEAAGGLERLKREPERQEILRQRNKEQSQKVFTLIERDDPNWLETVTGVSQASGR
jgi:hypothetical protein